MEQATQRSQRKWLVFVTIGIGVYAWVVDASAINVALPSVSSHFHASLPTVQWVVLGYTLAVTALLIPMGKAADYVGRKRLYLLGFITYVVGALLASIAQDVNGLLIARLIQAVGAAAVQGNGMAMAVAAFPAKERGIMLGCYSLTVGVAATTGPVFGGLLIDAFGWRSVLVTTGALGLVALLMGQAILPSGTRSISRHGPKVDWAGMTIAPITMVSLFLIPSRGPVVGWTSPILFLTSAVAGVGLVAFIVAELKASNPVIDLRMFANRRFSLGTMAVFLTFSGLSGSMFILPFYLQVVAQILLSAAA
ncbi:MFS transporter [Dehalococcoidia bacterium]|nr:MFS transporter [Dehalococcoidia bacterium]